MFYKNTHRPWDLVTNVAIEPCPQCSHINVLKLSHFSDFLSDSNALCILLFILLVDVFPVTWYLFLFCTETFEAILQFMHSQTEEGTPWILRIHRKTLNMIRKFR